jgi:hypothetical protein
LRCQPLSERIHSRTLAGILHGSGVILAVPTVQGRLDTFLV